MRRDEPSQAEFRHVSPHAAKSSRRRVARRPLRRPPSRDSKPRYTYDVYKMAIAMALDTADVGIMVLLMKRFANMTGGNIAYHERAVRELSRSKMTLIVPLAVIGIEPQDWNARDYPASSSAPKATASIINKARKLRGQTPVVPGSREDEVMSLDRLRQPAARVA